MTYDSRISKLEAEIDELDREYYRSKLEELSWCLPVVRAAKDLYDVYTLEDQTKDYWKTDPVLSPRLASLFYKVEALLAAEVKP